MAEEDDIELDDDEEQTGKKKGLFIIIGIVVLLGGAAGAYFMGLFDGMLGKGEKQEEVLTTEGEEAEGTPVEAVTTYYDLPDLLVNLSTTTNQTSFLKMKVTLELPSQADLDAAQQKLPAIMDHFNTYLRDLRATDLSGSAGMYRLREELLIRANKTMAPNKVSNILFREILVQ